MTAGLLNNMFNHPFVVVFVVVLCIGSVLPVVMSFIVVFCAFV
jgi:hypothetical protein